MDTHPCNRHLYHPAIKPGCGPLVIVQQYVFHFCHNFLLHLLTFDANADVLVPVIRLVWIIFSLAPTQSAAHVATGEPEQWLRVLKDCDSHDHTVW